MRRLKLWAFLLFPLLVGAQAEPRWLELGHQANARIATRWVQTAKSAASLTLSRDGEAVQSLHLKIANDPGVRGSAAELLERSVRASRRQYPEEYLQLLAAERVELGLWRGLCFDMGQRDENGLRWRTRAYELNRSGQQLSVVFRAPEVYFFERDLEEIETMIRSIE